jgi:glycosyltransferase involved in cell wall biosynthesis
MRILVIIYEFPPIGGGGGQAALDISRELVKRGHQVRVLTSRYEDLPRGEIVDGVEVRRVPAMRRSAYQADLATMFGFVLSGIWSGMRMMRRWRPDVIHVHFAVPSGPVAWALSRWKHIPYVLTVHLGDVPKGVPDKTDRWFRWIYPFTPPIWRSAAQVTAVSEHTRSLAVQYYPVNPQVIPNGINLAQLDPGEIQASSPPRIVFAGRLVHQKNPLQLVRSLANLKHLEWECAILGDGPLRSEVAREIEACGLMDRFILSGWVTPGQVVERLSHSDILFMPSLSEGLSIVGLQALSMGLAIVASRIGGFVDLVDHGVNGYLIGPPGFGHELSGPTTLSADGYASALEELLRNPARLQAFRLASRHKAWNFDIQRVAESYEQVLMAASRGGQGE